MFLADRQLHSGWKATRTRREYRDLHAIYRRLYPWQDLHFYLYDGADPLWSAPTILEHEITVRPQHLGAEFIARLVEPGSDRQAGVVTVMISIPRLPDPGEQRCTCSAWQPRRGLGWLHRLNPLFYEQLRHKLRKLRLQLAARQTTRATSLPCALATRQSAPYQPTSGKAPAILIGVHWLETGGAEELALDCVHWACEAGLRVFVVAAVPGLQRLADRFDDAPDVEFLRLDRYLPHEYWPRYIENLVRTENIQLIHIHHCAPLYEALPQLRATVPWIRVIDSTHIVEPFTGDFPKISGRWSNYIDQHHVISAALKDYFRDQFQLMGKVALGRMQAPNGLATPLPFSMVERKQSLHIAFIGRLSLQKRPLLMVAMLRRLMDWAQRNQVTLSADVVGEGPLRPELVRLIRRSGIGGRVRLLPAQADIRSVLRRADILLLPSEAEGLPLVCLEAVEHGCIPLATHTGAVAEIVPEELLLPLSPRASLRAVIGLTDKLWRDAAFLEAQTAELRRRHAALQQDPDAKAVLMTSYREAAASTGP